MKRIKNGNMGHKCYFINNYVINIAKYLEMLRTIKIHINEKYKHQNKVLGNSIFSNHKI